MIARLLYHRDLAVDSSCASSSGDLAASRDFQLRNYATRMHFQRKC
jgi:hypothetical protein